MILDRLELQGLRKPDRDWVRREEGSPVELHGGDRRGEERAAPPSSAARRARAFFRPRRRSAQEGGVEDRIAIRFSTSEKTWPH